MMPEHGNQFNCDFFKSCERYLGMRHVLQFLDIYVFIREIMSILWH